MIKYLIDRVARDAQKAGEAGQVVYVKLYDDKAPGVILATVCVAYKNKEQFEADLEAKTAKYLAGRKTAEDIRTQAEQSLAAVENKVNRGK